eukprot:12925775-Prorocentrum_lima.AAC.1
MAMGTMAVPPEPASSTPRSEDVLPEAASSSEPGGQEQSHWNQTGVQLWEHQHTKEALVKETPDEPTSGRDDLAG